RRAREAEGWPPDRDRSPLQCAADTRLVVVKGVAVIGAGAAGLASARWLWDAGLETVVFERTGAVGGLWRPDTGLAYPSLRTNTSEQNTGLSDLACRAALTR